MTTLEILNKRIEKSEMHFLSGLEMLKRAVNNIQDAELKSRLQYVIDELERSETPYDEVMQYVRALDNKAVDNAPRFTATCVVELPKEDRGLERSIVRLNTSRMDQTRQDKTSFYRRQPVKICNPLTGQYIIRMPMGGGGLKGLTRDCIALDYDSVDALGVRSGFIEGRVDADLVVSKANAFSIYSYYWDHPDVGYRLAMRLSMIGLALGIIGFMPMVFGLV